MSGKARVLVLLGAKDLDAAPREGLLDETARCIPGATLEWICFTGSGEQEFLAPLTDDGSPVLALRDGRPLEHGARQKLALRLAIERDLDLVVLLSDLAALRAVPTLIDTWVGKSEADLLLIAGPRRSLATRLQNRWSGLRLSSYRPAARAVAVELLRRLPYETNSDDERFDLELLFQTHYVGGRIAEIEPTPAAKSPADPPRRGDLATTLRYALHRMGMACSLKYRHLLPERYVDKTAIPYSSHDAALAVVRRLRPATVLDLGCGSGFVARRCQELGARVTGVDRRAPQDGCMSEFHLSDLEHEAIPVAAWSYDLILLLDVIEHLEDPEGFLLALRGGSREGETERAPPRVVLSTPNVAFIAVRLNLLFGRFPYAERGILDITHKRLFTRTSLCEMLHDCGFVIHSVRPVPVPFRAVVGGGIGKLLGSLAAALARLWPTLFAFQWLVECEPRPNLHQMLEISMGSDSRQSTDGRL